MNAQTIKRVNLRAEFNEVDYNLIIRQGRLNRIKFSLWYNGREVLMSYTVLVNFIGQDNAKKVLSTVGNIAIVNNTLIEILED